MRVRFRFGLLAMISVIALVMALGCEDEPEDCNLNISVSPPNEGNFVYVYQQEFINEEGELQTATGGEPELYKIPSVANVPIRVWIKKVRLVAVPGPGYKFDHWEGLAAYGKTGDYFDLDVYPDTDEYVQAHFVPVPYEGGPSEWATPEETGDPSDWGEDETETSPDTVLSVNLQPRVEIIEGPSGCISSILYVNYEATDYSGGGHPVDFVQLKKDGEEWHTWQGVPTAHYQDDTLMEVPCLGFPTLQLSATNRDGVEVDVVKDVFLPHTVSSLTWKAEEIPGEECRMKLKLDLWGADNYGSNRQLTSLVLTANGDPWYEKYGLITNSHEHSLSPVLLCGQIFSLELTATDVDGNKYTWRETVTIPTPEPQDEPPPEEPPDAPPAEETLYVAFGLSGQCTQTETGCKCTVSYSVDAEDRSAGDKYPVTNVKFEVNDGTGWKVWHNSGAISTSAYHHADQETGVACGKTFSVRVTATNSIGQTVTATGSFTTASP